jgi:cytosine/adenosine deaminase-related metal-dependent hydrolase
MISAERGEAWALRNADIGGQLTTLRFKGSQILSVGERIQRRDRCIDLEGDRLLPGLINAHDHLQWNGLPRQKSRNRYENVREWIADVGEAGANEARRYEESVSRRDRLWAGGIKNLLSGVTTVAHHDPLFAELSDPRFPIQVVSRYGWVHSLGVAGEQIVQRSNEATPAMWPWIVHAAEGVDHEAGAEIDTLERLGCIKANTLIVHGVGMDAMGRARLIAADAGLIWCPSSNVFMFGKTVDVTKLAVAGQVALGSDSRLTGARDLLEELRIAHETSNLSEEILESIVTVVAARRLRLGDRGCLRTGAQADLLILPRGHSLSDVSRADVRLVVVGGGARFGDVHYTSHFSFASEWTAVTLDGCSKMLAGDIAATYQLSHCREPGLEINLKAGRAA